MAVTRNTKGNRKEYHYWDYSFEWTDQHLQATELEPWTQQCDTLADECTEILDKLNQPVKLENGSDMKKDRYALLRNHFESNPKLTELWTQINTIPDWVDWAQIQRGQDIYWRYFIPITNTVQSSGF